MCPRCSPSKTPTTTKSRPIDAVERVDALDDDHARSPRGAVPPASSGTYGGPLGELAGRGRVDEHLVGQERRPPPAADRDEPAVRVEQPDRSVDGIALRRPDGLAAGDARQVRRVQRERRAAPRGRRRAAGAARRPLRCPARPRRAHPTRPARRHRPPAERVERDRVLEPERPARRPDERPEIRARCRAPRRDRGRWPGRTSRPSTRPRRSRPAGPGRSRPSRRGPGAWIVTVRGRSSSVLARPGHGVGAPAGDLDALSRPAAAARSARGTRRGPPRRSPGPGPARRPASARPRGRPSSTTRRSRPSPGSALRVAEVVLDDPRRRARGRAAGRRSRTGRACRRGRPAASPLSRRTSATTSCEVGPAGLATTRMPSSPDPRRACDRPWRDIGRRRDRELSGRRRRRGGGLGEDRRRAPRRAAAATVAPAARAWPPPPNRPVRTVASTPPGLVRTLTRVALALLLEQDRDLGALGLRRAGR